MQSDITVHHRQRGPVCPQKVGAARGAFKAGRYAGWDSGMGKQILDKELGLAAVADLAAQRGLEPTPRSGRQEYLENLVSRYM